MCSGIIPSVVFFSEVIVSDGMLGSAMLYFGIPSVLFSEVVVSDVMLGFALMISGIIPLVGKTSMSVHLHMGCMVSDGMLDCAWINSGIIPFVLVSEIWIASGIAPLVGTMSNSVHIRMGIMVKRLVRSTGGKQSRCCDA